MLRDLALGWRRLLQTPGFTAFGILTLALGIGATTAAYSVIHAVLFKGTGVAAPSELVNIYHSNPRAVNSASSIALSWPDYQDLRASQDVFSGVTAWARFRQAVVRDGFPEILPGEVVAGDYFQLLGVSAALGRVIQPFDDGPGATPVAVLSHRVWKRLFNADPAVVGTTVTIKGSPFEIVGVLPDSFGGVDVPTVIPTSIWVPLFHAEALRGLGPTSLAANDRSRRWLKVKARLKHDASVDASRQQVSSIAARLDVLHPLSGGRGAPVSASYQKQRAWYVMPSDDVLVDESVDGIARPAALALLLSVTLVLLVACTNLANMALARGAGRRQELATKLALGATPWHLVREQLAEATLLAAAGMGAALLVARYVLWSAFASDIPLETGGMVVIDAGLAWPVLGLTALVTMLTLAVFGLLPAAHLVSLESPRRFRSVGHGAITTPWKGSRGMLVGQISVSAVLLGVAALAVQQILMPRGLTSLNLSQVVVVRLDFGLHGEREPGARKKLDEILEISHRALGAKAVGVSTALPFGLDGPSAWVASNAVDSRPVTVQAGLAAADPAFFEALGIAIVRGRGFSSLDGFGAPPAAIVTERTAQSLFNTTDVVGRYVVVRQNLTYRGEPLEEPRMVIGVAVDVDAESPHRRAGMAYVPFSQHFDPAVVIVAHGFGASSTLEARLRELVRRVAPELAITSSAKGDALALPGMEVVRIVAALTGALGLVALVLSMAGLYGMLSFAVRHRTREVGIRMALGANSATIVRLVVAQGMRPVMTGLALGLCAGAVSHFALRAVYTRTFPDADPAIVLFLVLPYVIAGLLACYVPARRAASMDPNIALKEL